MDGFPNICWNVASTKDISVHLCTKQLASSCFLSIGATPIHLWTLTSWDNLLKSIRLCINSLMLAGFCRSVRFAPRKKGEYQLSFCFRPGRRLKEYETNILKWALSGATLFSHIYQNKSTRLYRIVTVPFVRLFKTFTGNFTRYKADISFAIFTPSINLQKPI